MAGLSKSRIIAHRQCPKRLWLQTHQPELAKYSPQALRAFDCGYQVGALACARHPGGVMLPDDLGQALNDTKRLLKQGHRCLFEATFECDGVLSRADILEKDNGSWVMVEVKSSTGKKDYHLEDTAVQAWVIESSGLKLDRIVLSHLDNRFVYPGNGAYAGLFSDIDITEEVRARQANVVQWIAEARATLAMTEAPSTEPGPQCAAPFECPFKAHCVQPPATRYPVELLPKRHAGKLPEQLREEGFIDLKEVPFDRFPANSVLRRVHEATVSGIPFLDSIPGEILSSLPWPRYYLDFETINPAVPVWSQSRPWQQIPFQCSCHVEQEDGSITAEAWLADGSSDPRPGFIESLIAAVGNSGAVLVYNAAFEKGRLQELARDFPRHAAALQAIEDRVFDLYPMTRDHYYHRDQLGSWSIKAVLPTIAPELDYRDLAIGNGTMAQDAFHQILSPETSREERDRLERALLEYCGLDTWAMVRLAHHLEGTQCPQQKA